MIFATVGTHRTLAFDRLVQAIDELAATLEEQVIIQRGCSTCLPRYAEHFQFAGSQDVDQYVERARVVICHAAAGAIITALRHNKPLIISPRRQQYGECIDDHQLQLAAALERRQRAIVVQDPSAAALRQALELASRREVPAGQASPLLLALRRQLEQWSSKTAHGNTTIRHARHALTQPPQE